MAVSAGVRRFGSAALDLAYVAAGRYDGFWERGLKTGILLLASCWYGRQAVLCQICVARSCDASGDVVAQTRLYMQNY